MIKIINHKLFESDNITTYERIKAVLPISKSAIKEMADKFDGVVENGGMEVNFNGNSDNLAKAVKYLRTSKYKNHIFIFKSIAYDTGYHVTPIEYNI